MATSFPLICLFCISPSSANVQSSSPYVRHHWPAPSCHSYQNWTAIYGASVVTTNEAHVLRRWYSKCEGGGGERRSCLVVREGKELLPQTVALLLLPLLCQEDRNLVAPADELVAVPPDRVRRVRELDDVGIPTTNARGINTTRALFASSSHVTAHCSKWGLGPGIGGKERGGKAHLVFQPSWAALTFLRAESSVNGGNGGFASRSDIVVGYRGSMGRKAVWAWPPGQVRVPHRSDRSPSYSCAGIRGTSRVVHDCTELGVVGTVSHVPTCRSTNPRKDLELYDVIQEDAKSSGTRKVP